MCDLTAVLLARITVVLSEGHCRREEPVGLFCTGVCGEELFSVSLPSSSPLFPYCSALYDNVVVNRVYSELALG